MHQFLFHHYIVYDLKLSFDDFFHKDTDRLIQTKGNDNYRFFSIFKIGDYLNEIFTKDDPFISVVMFKFSVIEIILSNLYPKSFIY